MGYADPTDKVNVEGIVDPQIDVSPDGLVLDDEPFGVPGLKVQ